MMLTPIKKQGDEHLSVRVISCVTDCRIADYIGLALLSICSLVRNAVISQAGKFTVTTFPGANLCLFV